MFQHAFSYVILALVSRRTLLFSIGIILLLGALSTYLDQQFFQSTDTSQSLNFSSLYRAGIAAYLIAAVHWVIDLTPTLVYRVRPVVKISDSDFERHANRVIGSRLNFLLKLAAPVFALIWAIGFILRVQIGDQAGINAQVSLTETLMPLTEVGFSLFAIWRMAQLARLSHQPLEINLYDTHSLYPFGQLSFAYAAIISVRMLIQIATTGFVEGVMAVIFTISSVASLLALVLPIWSVHRQLRSEKQQMLQQLAAQMNQVTRSLFAQQLDKPEHLQSVAASLQTIGSIHERIANIWTWPVPNSITAIQVLLLSTAPTLLNLLKTYILPMVNSLYGS